MNRYKIKKHDKNNLRRLFSNKKGDIAITILVIGVFVISSFAIMSFITSDFSYGNSFVGISIIEKINSDIDEYNFYKNNNVRKDIINSEFNFIEKNGKKYLYYEKNSSGWFGGNEKLSFSVQYPVQVLP